MTRNKIEKVFFHRIFILFIILILPIFFYKEYRLIKSKKETRTTVSKDFCENNLEKNKDKFFTFIVLTHNNIDTIKKNVESIINQNYDQYDIIFIDRYSTDGTKKLIFDLMEQEKCSIKLIECKKDSNVYQSYYDAVHNCSGDTVIVHLYGNDWLADNDILIRLNHSYSNPDVWLTYGQYLDFSNYKRGVYQPHPKKVLYKKRVQRAPWAEASFKTFYASLFQQIQIEPEYFLSIDNDNTLLSPMLELAKAHVRFIPDVLTIHSETIPREKKEHQFKFFSGKIMESNFDKGEEKVAELIIFSEERPLMLKTCLESSKHHLHGLGKIHVIYNCTEENYIGYELLKNAFPEVHFIRPTPYADVSFKDSLLRVILENSSPYVILTTDHMELKKKIILPTCIEAMRKTCAFGFYLHLGKERIIGDGSLQKGIYMWNIRKNVGSWGEPDTLQMGLYRRLDLEKALKELSFTSTQGLIESWGRISHTNRLGLSFEEPVTSTISSYSKKEF